MKILVIGSGGREHALVWKLRQSAAVEKLWCAPGNGGIAQHAECIALDLNDVTATADLAERLGADLTVVGPEAPLVLGIVNEFTARALPVLGPSRQAAQLEGSKIFAKQFMDRHRIPTAGIYGIHNSAAEALRTLDHVRWPLVIKADGLCAGKGVLVTSSRPEAETFIERLMAKKEFGTAGERILLEHGLRGEELSYIILTDGQKFIPMVPTRDHKRAYDNDQGPNTGGMGAYSADEMLSSQLERTILDTIVQPTLKGLRDDRLPYSGFLYFGLMLTSDGPKVLEYNCRLGDPETEAILLRADFELAEACLRAAMGDLGAFDAKWAPGASICVVVASEGYPANPLTGRRITGLPAIGSETDNGERQAVVFHAGTSLRDSNYYTTGGRVLVVAASGENVTAASQTAYNTLSRIRIDGSFYRKDIGGTAPGKRSIAAESSKL